MLLVLEDSLFFPYFILKLKDRALDATTDSVWQLNLKLYCIVLLLKLCWHVQMFVNIGVKKDLHFELWWAKEIQNFIYKLNVSRTYVNTQNINGKKKNLVWGFNNAVQHCVILTDKCTTPVCASRFSVCTPLHPTCRRGQDERPFISG